MRPLTVKIKSQKKKSIFIVFKVNYRKSITFLISPKTQNVISLMLTFVKQLYSYDYNHGFISTPESFLLM